jgi:hypothetical protein
MFVDRAGATLAVIFTKRPRSRVVAALLRRSKDRFCRMVGDSRSGWTTLVATPGMGSHDHSARALPHVSEPLLIPSFHLEVGRLQPRR